MRLLIIGGTSFIGRHVAAEARRTGWEVTAFNRGLTDPDALPWAEHIRGDRERPADLAILSGREWDAVVDTCGFDHRVVSLSNDVLRDRVGHYTFVSSIAVYRCLSRVNVENDATLDLDGDEDDAGERPYGGSMLYGSMKARCEQVIALAFPGRWLAVRPTSVAGPLDRGASNRRTGYWAARVREYDEILVPRPRDRPVSYIDVRDMAAWIVRQAQSGVTGPFNLAAPSLTIDEFLETTRGIYDTRTQVVWVDPDWLVDQGVTPNVELPLWVPTERNLFAIDAGKAMAHGLTIRPIAETIRDSADWEDVRPNGFAPQSPLAGQGRGALMSRPRELELLARWRARVGAGAR